MEQQLEREEIEMATLEAAPPPTEDEIAALNSGSELYRLYVLDVDSDPEDPQLRALFKKGDTYPDVQSRVRAILKGEGQPGDQVYLDAACTEVFEVEPDANWNLTLVRKQRARGVNRGVDREWLRMVIEDPSKTPEEKLAAMAKFV